jgi:HPt (histidine-containing phosphotransfer) domain-containing protein
VNAEVKSGVFDREVALARVGGDAGLLKELAELFLEEYPSMLAELRAASAQADAKAIERTAHGLKGSVANFGARTAVEAALRLEQLGREENLAEVERALASLELALAAVHVELARL